MRGAIQAAVDRSIDRFKRMRARTIEEEEEEDDAMPLWRWTGPPGRGRLLACHLSCA